MIILDFYFFVKIELHINYSWKLKSHEFSWWNCERMENVFWMVTWYELFGNFVCSMASKLIYSSLRNERETIEWQMYCNLHIRPTSQRIQGNMNIKVTAIPWTRKNEHGPMKTWYDAMTMRELRGNLTLRQVIYVRCSRVGILGIHSWRLGSMMKLPSRHIGLVFGRANPVHCHGKKALQLCLR